MKYISLRFYRVSTSIHLLIFIISIIWCRFSFAQNSDAPKEVTATFFLENLNVVQKPGVLLAKTNLIIKNGLIDNVGKDLKIPADAQVIKADSMFAYAGFIDAYSHTGIEKVESKDQPRIVDPGNPPNDVAGITPQKTIMEIYKPLDKSVSELRSVGFTMATVAPRGLMLPGQTSLVQLKDGATDHVIMKKDIGMAAQFTTNRSTFPSTIIGVMAKFRELYKNAEILHKTTENYSMNPAGLNRPVLKKEEWSLVPVTRKMMPVYFVASSSNQISRALQLQKELGFDLVLTSVKQGNDWVEEIKKQGAKCVLSLDLPEDKKEKKEETPKEKGKEEKAKEEKAKEEKPKEEKPISKEEKLFEEKRQQALKMQVGQAATFERAGLPFAFSTLDAKPAEIHKNLRRMVNEGLTEKMALEALTVNPATLLGLSSSVGTLEKGKIANIVIMDKSLFHDKSKVSYVFIDGKMYDFKGKKEADKPTKDDNPITGEWNFEVKLGQESETGTMSINFKDDTYSISLVTDERPLEPVKGFDIKVNNNNIVFSINWEEENHEVALEIDLLVDGKSFKGNVSSNELGTFPITGEKKSPPKK